MSTKITVLEQLKKEPKNLELKALMILGLIGIGILGFVYIDYNGFTEFGLTVMWNISKSIFTPNTALLFGEGKNGVLFLITETAAIAFLGTIIGTIVSIPIAFLSSRNIVPGWMANIGVAFITVVRNIPGSRIWVDVYPSYRSGSFYRGTYTWR
jgi:phosphonate transport system permease protein